jgi:hypothetical protein
MTEGAAAGEDSTGGAASCCRCENVIACDICEACRDHCAAAVPGDLASHFEQFEPIAQVPNGHARPEIVFARADSRRRRRARH